jgi:hypothetical protein
VSEFGLPEGNERHAEFSASDSNRKSPASNGLVAKKNAGIWHGPGKQFRVD